MNVFIKILIGLLAAAFIYLGYLIFNYSPLEAVMGFAQKIMYIHVPSAIASYICVAVLFYGSIKYLISGTSRAASIRDAGAEVGFVFSVVVMITGMLWGYTSWGTWWNFEPRLVSFLILTLILGGMLLIRAFFADESRHGQLLTAVMGIIAAINVPIVMFSDSSCKFKFSTSSESCFDWRARG